MTRRGSSSIENRVFLELSECTRGARVARRSNLNILQYLLFRGIMIASVDNTQVVRVFQLDSSDSCPEHSFTSAAGIAVVELSAPANPKPGTLHPPYQYGWKKPTSRPFVDSSTPLSSSSFCRTPIVRRRSSDPTRRREKGMTT